MKKYLIILISLIYLLPLKACDVCGCGIRDASFNMGFAQSIRAHLFLTGVQQFSFQTQVNQYTVADRVTRIPLQYIHQISDKWQAQVSTDIQQIQRNNAFNENTKWSQITPSDLFISGNYRLFDNRKNIFTPHHYLWFVGGTLKLPTGYYQSRDNQKRMLPMQLQSGNGSYAAGIQTSFSYRYKSWGLNSMFQTLANATNELSYRQGAQTQLLLGFNRVFSRGKSNHTFIPQIAYAFQTFQPDIQYHTAVPYSGGAIQSIQFQIEWIYKSIYALAQYQLPQNISVPMGAPVVQTSAQLRLGYLIASPKKEMEKTIRK
jgi:hypothetical protein